MPIGDVLQARFVTRFAEQAGIIVRHWRISAVSGAEQTLTAIATNLGNVTGLLLRNLMTSSASYVFVGVSKIRPLPVSLEVTSTVQAGVGDHAGDALPRQVSGLISLRSALAGKRNRGRSYVPFPPESDNALNAVPTASYVTRLGLLRDELLLSPRIVGPAPNETTLIPVVFRRVAGTTQDLILGLPRTVWATQRRRGSFGRPDFATV